MSPWYLSRRGVVGLLAALLLLAAAGAWLGWTMLFPSSNQLTYIVDADQLARRFHTHRDIYEKVRDEALADYVRRNPAPQPYDSRVRGVIRMFAYLWVWHDLYGECLGARAAGLVSEAQQMGCTDPILQSFIDSQVELQFESGDEQDAQDLNRNADLFLATGYPAALKLGVCRGTLGNLVGFLDNHPPAESKALDARAHFVEEWGRSYRKLIEQRLPHDQLYHEGEQMLHTLEDDEAGLRLMHAEEDHDFDVAAPNHPVRLELDGAYEVADAWSARGSDWADTVKPAGWQSFGERLERAANILEPLYVHYPQEKGTCLAMMKVELGRGDSRDRMETWFQRGIKIDPDDLDIYAAKEWYLQPRWNGSKEDVLAFGRECVRGGNWEATIPLIMTNGVKNLAGDDEDRFRELYQDPAIWAEVEPVFREYLRRYPFAINVRSSFALHAFQGGHLDIAREQFKILGEFWDPFVVPQDKYAAIMAVLNPK